MKYGLAMESATNDTMMYVTGMSVFLNRWFATYELARESLDEEGGFLFPYKNHFFVTEEGAIPRLGLDPDDPDWDLIGHDWVRPDNREAWERLREKRRCRM